MSGLTLPLLVFNPYVREGPLPLLIMGLVTVCFSGSAAGSPSFHLSFRAILCHSTYFVGLVPAKPSQNKLICHYFLSAGVVYWSQNMLFLTNEPGKKAEINILPARDTTGPGY